MRPWASTGRRLGDGAHVAGTAPMATSFAYVLLAGLAAVAIATCPTHDHFEAYLAAAAEHPSSFLGALGSVFDKARISLGSESKSYLVARTGKFRGGSFLGALGTWVVLPRLPRLQLHTLSLASLLPTDGLARAVCGGGGAPPHETFALLCVLGFVVCSLWPRAVWRHGICSLSALTSGRLWVVLTANVLHFSPLHLLHTLLQVLQFGPVLHAALGCERAAALLCLAGLGASAASILWNGVLQRRPGSGSVGGSGVAMGLAAANAALFPRTRVSMYGVELSAPQQLLLYLALDVAAAGAAGAAGAIDVSAHAGGALAGWLVARHWRPPWLW